MISSVGTWDWAESTGGRLSRRDRAELLRQGVLARLSLLPGPWAGNYAGGALELPDAPDSTLAREAEAAARELSSPELYGHCLRTWAFSALFAAADRVDHDPELLYLACVLHDLGLTEPHDQKDPTAHCFAVEGGRAAQGLVCAHGASEEQGRTVAEAISLHLNVTVPESLGAEAYLLSKGVSLDVIGRRFGQLPAASVDEVNGRWSRAGAMDDLLAGVGRQAKVRPDSRAGFNFKLGFKGMVKANPMDR